MFVFGVWLEVITSPIANFEVVKETFIDSRAIESNRSCLPLRTIIIRQQIQLLKLPPTICPLISSCAVLFVFRLIFFNFSKLNIFSSVLQNILACLMMKHIPFTLSTFLSHIIIVSYCTLHMYIILYAKQIHLRNPTTQSFINRVKFRFFFYSVQLFTLI